MNLATASMPTITVHTDTGPLRLPAGCTLSQALEHLLPTLNKLPEHVATAVNGAFVPRGERGAHLLQDGDAVLCFSPITGG